MRELQSGILLQGGKYKIDKSLGQGGFGITYLAEQTNLNRKICIKEFFMKEYGERTESADTDADATVLTGVSAVTSAAAEIMGRYREKFVKEARTIARLDHPGIVRIHDVFEENGTAYYVMDFIEGENLNDLVKREGALSEDRALGYIRQIADALSYVHSHNIMHLDVKPANVLVRKSDDKAILIDFGTAKQYDSEGTQTSTTPVGLSAGYAPIEMTKPGGVQTFSPETDVYSLGATLYYLVTGQNPPDASERIEMIMEGETLPYPGNISQTVIDAIEKALQSRKKRPQTVAAFLELLPATKPEKIEKKSLEFCPNCGEKLSPNAKFCPNCGTPIVIMEASPDNLGNQEEEFDIESITVISGSETVFNFEVTMPSSLTELMVFFAFLRSDSPIYNLEDRSLPFGDRVLINNPSGKTLLTDSISLDFSGSQLAYEPEGNVTFDLMVTLSKHLDTTDLMEDDRIRYFRITLYHKKHRFKHDEWLYPTIVAYDPNT